MGVAFVYSEREALASELVSFCRQSGLGVFALSFSDDESAQLADCGADGIVQSEEAAAMPEACAKSIADLMRERNVELLVVGATAIGRDLAARTAGYLDCAMLGDVESVTYDDGHLEGTRVMYGGSVAAPLSADSPAVITISAGHFEPASGPAAVEKAAIPSDGRIEVVSTEPVAYEGVDITQAKRVIAVGMGIREEADLDMVRALADAIGAELACSRGIAEDRKWLPIEQYVGLSGASIAPDLCIEIGISGQAQHIVGIRDSKLVVAINSDADAPVFRAADYGVVGDLYEIVPLLTEALS